MNIAEIREALLEIVTDIEAVQDALEGYRDEDEPCGECIADEDDAAEEVEDIAESDEDEEGDEDEDDGDDPAEEDAVEVDVTTKARNEFVGNMKTKERFVEGISMPASISEASISDKDVVLVVPEAFLNDYLRDIIVE
jgi:hypothetical protein